MTEYFDISSNIVIERRKLAGAEGHVLYQYPADLPLAIRVAQATQRPLLLLGEPGCGKSSLARDVAISLGHAYIEEVITSRTVARELLWRFDHVRRLSDAPIERDKVGNLRHYLEPGPMWWSIDPASARLRGTSPNERDKLPVKAAVDPSLVNSGSSTGTVLLLDEIDKADPDVPNDLLVALGEYRFDIPDPPTEVRKPKGRSLLVFLTSNGERDLPNAFMRRCIPFELKRPEPRLLKPIIRAHCVGLDVDTAQLETLIEAVVSLLEAPPAFAARLRAPGTAEAIDAVRACLAERITSGPPNWIDADPRWSLIMRLTLWKQTEPTAPAVQLP